MNRDTDDLVEVYVAALAVGDAETALATLSPDAVLHSPFHTWPARHVPSVFHARGNAFSGLRIDTVMRSDERAAVLWRATVNDADVEAVELLSLGGGAICRIDVFLRPAEVLDSVEQAMVKAWPRGRRRRMTRC
jgi:hypothetical protein